MTVVFSWIATYLYQTPKKVALAFVLLVGLLVFLNYHFHLEQQIRLLPHPALSIACFFLLYTLVLSSSFSLLFQLTGYYIAEKKRFTLLLFSAALIFALKTGIPSTYWTQWISKDYLGFLKSSLHWPILALLLTGLLFIFKQLIKLPEQSLGLSLKKFNPYPYMILIGGMIPFLILAALQKDFQSMYPKFQHAAFPPSGIGEWILYELCYGTDFFSIELFFRGFLVLAFIQLAGKESILPVAAFYCSIHFGKPLLECISSFFGGCLLGIIVYRSESIWGGLIVHLGIAWLMEVAGILMP